MRQHKIALENDNNLHSFKLTYKKIINDKDLLEFVNVLRGYFYLQYDFNKDEYEKMFLYEIERILEKCLITLNIGSSNRQEISKEFGKALPMIRELVLSDIKAAYERDPAAESYMEIIMAYPGPLAILIQRTAHCFYQLKVKTLQKTSYYR